MYVCVYLQVWQSVLWQLQKLLSPEEAADALDSNIECFHKASAIIKILLTSKVHACHINNPHNAPHIYAYSHISSPTPKPPPHTHITPTPVQFHAVVHVHTCMLLKDIKVCTYVHVHACVVYSSVQGIFSFRSVLWSVFQLCLPILPAILYDWWSSCWAPLLVWTACAMCVTISL